jgi:hypothetical protein
MSGCIVAKSSNGRLLTEGWFESNRGASKLLETPRLRIMAQRLLEHG